MTEREQVEAFANELGSLIYRYRDEFDLTVASMVGVLECAKLMVYEDGGDINFEVELEGGDE